MGLLTRVPFLDLQSGKKGPAGQEGTVLCGSVWVQSSGQLVAGGGKKG